MKKLSLIACIACLFVACNTANTSTNSKDTMAATDTTAMSINENVTYAYPVSYSSDFAIGDSKYAQTVLELWKDYDNNTFDKDADDFSDSVSMDFPDGSTVKGKDSAMTSAKTYRSSLKNAVSSVEAITTLKPNGKDETWVCVWGKEVDTHQDGKMDSIYLNENWMFNKDGKVAYMSQLMAKGAPPAKK
jgi:hypothetical protein